MGPHRFSLPSAPAYGLCVAMMLACGEGTPGTHPLGDGSPGPRVGGQSTDDMNPHDQGQEPADSPERCERGEPLLPDSVAVAQLGWVEQDYPMVGWLGGPDGQALNGVMEVQVKPSGWYRASGCRFGALALLTLELRDGEDRLLAAGDAVAGFLPELLEPPPPDIAYDHETHLGADLSLHVDPASLDLLPGWTADRAYLRAILSPYGSGGVLIPQAEPEVQPMLDDNTGQTGPPADPVLTWPAPGACGEDEGGMTAGQGPEMADTRADLEALNRSAATVYEDLGEGLVEVGTLVIEVDAPELVCGFRMPTSASLRIDGADVDLVAGLAIDTIVFEGQRTLGINYDEPYVFTPELFARQLGAVGVDLAGYTYVGVELWLRIGETPNGELRVVTWTGNDCLLCDAGACRECAEDRKVITRTLAVGEAP